MTQDAAVNFSNLGQLFIDIDLETQWEPRLSPHILSEFEGNNPYQAPTGILPTLPPTLPPSGVPANTPPSGNSPPGGNPIPNQIVTNTNYNTDIFEVYKNKRLNHGVLRNNLTARPPASPHSSFGEEMCLS